MDKKLYLVIRPEENVDYEEDEGFVICAKDKEHTKKFLPDVHNYREDDYRNKCTFLDVYTDAEIVYIGKAKSNLPYGIVLVANRGS